MRKLTRPLAAVCALAAAAAGLGQTTAPPPSPAKAQAAAAPAARLGPLEAVPEEVFARELKDLDGQSFSLSDFRGQALVLNVWASWCGPCHAEMPELNKLYEEFAPRGVGFVGLTIEDPEHDAAKVLTFVAQHQLKFAVGWADRETAVALFNGRTNIPQTFVVAPDGRVVKHFVGFNRQRSPVLLREAVRRALGEIE